MTLKTKKILNFTYLAVIIVLILGMLVSHDFNASEMTISQIVAPCLLLIVAVINVLTVLKQEKLEGE